MGLFYLCSQNKGADQMCGNCAADWHQFVFAYAKCRFSHDVAHAGFKLGPDSREK